MSMDRRHFAVKLGLAGLGAGLVSRMASADEGGVATGHAHHNHNHDHNECLDNCRSCERVCLETIQHCIQMGGAHVKAEHLRLLMDCAEICHASATLMISGSELSPRMCGLCADACTHCADSCSKVPQDDQMKACVEACQQCAKTCLEMAKGK